MIRNLYILSEGSWGIKSSEIFADLFYFISLLAVYGLFLFFQPGVYLVSTILCLVLSGLYYYYLLRTKNHIYPIAIASQILLYLLLLPFPLFHPAVVVLALLSGFFFHAVVSQNYSVKIPVFWYLLLFSFIWDSVFSLMGLGFRSQNPASLFFPGRGEVDPASLGPNFALPLFRGANFTAEPFRSSFEILSTYVLIGISWVAFRRPVLFFYFLGWILLYSVMGFSTIPLPFAWIVSFSSVSLISHISPGRNFYGSFFVTIFGFIIVLPISFLIAKLNGNPFLIFMLFFPLEGVFVRVFLGK